MEIGQMKQHYRDFDKWTDTLRGLSDGQWHTQVGEGKWSVAAVVAHLLFWDKYSLEERFPFFKEGAVLPSYPDFQGVNDTALEHAEKIATKEEILGDLYETRKGYHKLLDELNSDKLAVSFQIGEHTLTVEDYLVDFIQHDQHHQKQVDHTLGLSLLKESN